LRGVRRQHIDRISTRPAVLYTTRIDWMTSSGQTRNSQKTSRRTKKKPSEREASDG
jgi:hypothetical protein